MNDPRSTDRIERSIVLNAPRSRVWRALTNAEEFGNWFRVDLAGQSFAVGQRTRGRITYPGYEHIWFDVTVERIEPEQLFSYRWHPFPVDPSVDYTSEPSTLVTFTLVDAPGGKTQLTVVESGFDQVPASRRLEAYRRNSEGWSIQMENIGNHVTAAG